jgi:uncharacterized membrane protein
MSAAHIWTTTLPAFLASLVEFVEAYTIVLAVGMTRGWRSAALGSIVGILLLAVAVVIFGPLLRAVPIAALELAIGILLVFFGLRWLRKAILRYAGAIAFHDEAKIFERERSTLAAGASVDRRNWPAIATAFNAVVLEGLEVVFIVIAVGATAGTLPYAGAGAAIAFVCVLGIGIAVRAPLSRVPENALKFVVGIMLSAFGTFWTGEGLRVTWPGDDAALLLLIAGYALVAALAVAIARRGLLSAGTGRA